MKYRNSLPQQNGKVCITDGGLETVLLFEKGIDLPGFASFTVFEREGGAEILDEYLRDYSAIAKKHEFGLVVDTHTWRANLDWGKELGYDRAALLKIHERSLQELLDFRAREEGEDTPILISGTIGPRGDGYEASSIMSVEEASTYHSFQAEIFANEGIDFISALTLPEVNEAVGIVRAASKVEVPVVISFTLETDGRLPSGQPLEDAIQECDSLTDSYCSYYMINCAHPTHFSDVIARGGEWVSRLGGLRANASRMSHEELDNSEELDSGNPVELGDEVAALFGELDSLSVVGGCCGTDSRHIAEIADSIAG